MTETVRITISPDHDGYVGRECPQCERYFKIMPGTGLTGTTDVHCPYCQAVGPSDQFFTREQIAYASNVAARHVRTTLLGALEETSANVNRQSRGLFDLKITMTGNQDEAVEHYQDKALETEVTCDGCGLSYKIYGIFATCPDCGAHNSIQILTTNLEVLRRQLSEDDHILQEMLKNSVSIFDAFGRTTTEHRTGTRVSFQNLDGAEKNLQALGLSLRTHVTREEWEFLHRSFQKRHVLTHNMGVIDDDYLARANDPDAILGRKIRVTGSEVERTIDLLQRLGTIFITPVPSVEQPAAITKREATKKNPYQLSVDALRLARLLFTKDEQGYGGYIEQREAQEQLGLGDLEFEAALNDLTEHHLARIESRFLQSTEAMPLALIADLDYLPHSDDLLVARILIKEDRYIANHELETLTDLPKDRVNRSVRRLKEIGAIDLSTATGTAPYAFRGAKATGNTLRYLRDNTRR